MIDVEDPKMSMQDILMSIASSDFSRDPPLGTLLHFKNLTAPADAIIQLLFDISGNVETIRELFLACGANAIEKDMKEALAQHVEGTIRELYVNKDSH